MLLFKRLTVPAPAPAPSALAFATPQSRSSASAAALVSALAAAPTPASPARATYFASAARVYHFSCHRSSLAGGAPLDTPVTKDYFYWLASGNLKTTIRDDD